SVIGAQARVDCSNCMVLGSINGVNTATADTKVGIGTTAPSARLQIHDNNGDILFGDAGCGSGIAGIGFASTLSGCNNYSLLGDGTHTFLNRPLGGTLYFRENNINQVAIKPGGLVTISNLGSAGSTTLCRNASNEISTCSSSIRYKQNINPFRSGL